MGDILSLLIKSAIVDNVVFIQYLAICPFIGMTSETDKAAGMGIATSFVIVLATAVTWPIYKLVMIPLHLEFLQTLMFILVIASLVQLVEFFLKKSIPSLYKSMGVYLALITTNCAVLGVTINNIDYSYTYVESLFNALGTGIGFLVAMIIFSGMRQKLENNKKVPESFKGVPITLVSASILSLAFMGFSGLVTL